MNDYEMDQILMRLKVKNNSKEIKRRTGKGMKFDVQELDPVMSSLDEYILKIKRGELIVDSEIENIEDFSATEVKLPEIGMVTLYEPSEISQARKDEAYKNSAKSEEKNSFKKTKNLGLNVQDFVIISLPDEDGKKAELVVDKSGKDVGKIVYDEKGNPSFQMAHELRDRIESALLAGKVRNFVEPKVIEDEVYLRDIDNFFKAIKEGKFNPEQIRSEELTKDFIASYSKRAVAAQHIKSGDYTALDATIAVTSTPEEKSAEEALDAEAKSAVKNGRLETPETQRDIAMEEENVDINKDEETKAVQTQPTPNKNQPDDSLQTDEKDKDNSSIPEDKKDEIEKVCDDKDYDITTIKSVLIIKDPMNLADFTENSHINRKGNEVTVIQFSSATGKEKYILIQDGVELGGDEHDDAIRDLVAPLKMQSGVVDKVEDNENFVNYDDQKIKINGYPNEISKNLKEEFKLKFDILMDRLQQARAEDDFKTADVIEGKMYDLCVEYGIYPDARIQEAAVEEKTEEEPEDEFDGHDPREKGYDPRGPKF